MATERTFGDLLREHRRRAEYSQEALAERAGLSVGAIAALEQGVRRAPYRDTVLALADALGISGVARDQFEETATRARRRSRASSTSLPVSLTPFVERNEVDELKALVADHRLITITGSGGVGKTRIAIEVARRIEALYDETLFVDLLPIRDGIQVTTQIAAEISTPVEGEDGLAAIVHHLRPRRALLVIDNCEHVVADAAAVIVTLLRRCPSLTVLATSRESLALSAELSYRLPSMDARAASELFVTRAQASDRTWSVDAQRLSIVAEICKELDGIPLAIELAASRISTLGIEALGNRLKGGLSLTGSRDLPLRHQTMAATIAWSYDLLSAPERVVFRQSSVAMTSFTLESAEEILADDNLPAGVIADTLSRLVQKCLINVEHVGTSTRFRFLESIRAFARERLSESGEYDATMLRAMAWLERKSTLLLRGFLPRSIVEHRVELENVRGAVRWATLRGDYSAIVSAAKILIGFSRVYTWSTRQSEARMLGLDVLDRLKEDEDPEVVARLICCLSTVITGAERMVLLPRAIPLLKQTGHLDRAAYLHAKLAEIECSRGNSLAAQEHVAKAEALLTTRELRCSRNGLVTALTCAYVCSLLRDFDKARAWLAQTEIPDGDTQELEAQIVLAEVEFREGSTERACQISKTSVANLASYPDDVHLTIMVFGNYARYLLHLGAESEAEDALRVSLRRAVDIRDFGFLYVTSSLARHAAALAARTSRAHLASRLLGACDAIDQLNGRPSLKDALAEDLATKSISAQLSQQRAEVLRAQGADEDLYELLEEFLAQPAAADSARPSATSSA
jgi:predicted ATPase/DNA-binding XRE family transcriptional regulator